MIIMVFIKTTLKRDCLHLQRASGHDWGDTLTCSMRIRAFGLVRLVDSVLRHVTQ